MLRTSPLDSGWTRSRGNAIHLRGQRDRSRKGCRRNVGLILAPQTNPEAPSLYRISTRRFFTSDLNFWASLSLPTMAA
jgi:hypothetical protein